MSLATCAPECRHILPGGQKCHAFALRDKPFCAAHLHRQSLTEANRLRKHSVVLPSLETWDAILMSIDQVLAAFAAGKISRRESSTCLYAIQLASRVLARQEQSQQALTSAADRSAAAGSVSAARSKLRSLPPANPESSAQEAAPPAVSNPDSPNPDAPNPDAPDPDSPDPDSTGPDAVPQPLEDVAGRAPSLSADSLPAGPATNLSECPGLQPGAAPSGEGETVPKGEADAVRDSEAEVVHESEGGFIEESDAEAGPRDEAQAPQYDPEPPPPLTRAQIRQRRSEIDINLQNYYEARTYYFGRNSEILAPPEREVMTAYFRTNIEPLEAERKALDLLEAPDPPCDSLPCDAEGLCSLDEDLCSLDEDLCSLDEDLCSLDIEPQDRPPQE